jgi:integrase
LATFKKLKSGKWQAQIARKGVRKSQSFNSKQDARDWAGRQEFLVLSGDSSEYPQAANGSGTLADIFRRYAREVSPKKRGARWEILRLERLANDPLGKVLVSDVKPAGIAEWRDLRLLQVAPASVNREMVLMSAVFTVARKEWGIVEFNPVSDVRKPSKPAPRDRRVSVDEVASLLAISGTDLTKQKARALHAFRFAIETGMRAGEIVGLRWKDVNEGKRVARLALTKNGTSRDVPLSTAAIELLRELPRLEDHCFAISSANLDALFRRSRDLSKIKDLRFHDSRHEAITRMAKKLDVLSLARVVGHKDIRMLQIYYNATAEELAQLLD